ncbi:hypothetical protein KSC_104990 [Ktedonobacter sp. SOSP1-52]|uniref:ATP-binding protein n=1 Tax=Ktedonobacter sp. SOSP1-52 TaxID=2778366 RepID=UPI0019157987|nr:ATP-binding protein [Ktedonobacter sp. SOSP1-52]GHO71607.1 hypothetical protein KSC_104990 [Ktedonobacter sp. SOSP1-52]
MIAESALPSLQARIAVSWLSFLLDSVLALVGTLCMTGLISVFQLYPRIPNISILYLLIVLVLASTRSLYAAILASVVAFLSFDYFLIPPLYVFTIDRPEEWIALCIFLIDALLIGQLTFLLRQRAQDAHRREQETHILYDLVRTTVEERSPEQLLQTIVHMVVRVFGSWGIRSGILFLPDAQGQLIVQASAPLPPEHITLTPEEYAVVQQVVQTGQYHTLHEHMPSRTKDLDTEQQGRHFQRRESAKSVEKSNETRLHCFPLKTGGKMLGVLCLRLAGGLLEHIVDSSLQEQSERIDARLAFFWTFLDQVTSVIERARLRRETLHMEVLRRTDALRTALLSSVSHDLRTPLVTIKTVAGNLLQHDVHWDENARETFAQTIEREADRLNRFVGNLLDISRIEGGALNLQKEQYLLESVVYEVLEQLDPVLKGRTVQVALPADLSPLTFDYLHVTQVLTNLLENAVRYSPPGSPLDLQVQVTNQEVVICLGDRGPGVPEEERERIFEKFYRVLVPGKMIPGSGIGLSVCRGLIEAHGGRIWEENREGGGACFFFTLPRTTTEEPCYD